MLSLSWRARLRPSRWMRCSTARTEPRPPPIRLGAAEKCLCARGGDAGGGDGGGRVTGGGSGGGGAGGGGEGVWAGEGGGGGVRSGRLDGLFPGSNGAWPSTFWPGGC